MTVNHLGREESQGTAESRDTKAIRVGTGWAPLPVLYPNTVPSFSEAFLGDDWADFSLSLSLIS